MESRLLRYVGILLLVSGSVSAQTPYPWLRHTVDSTSLGADGTKICWANRDSLPDIVTGWEQGNVTRLYFHPGDPKEKWEYVEVPSPAVEDALVVDLDQDGFPDIVTFSEGSHQRITVHWAPSSWPKYSQSEAWQSEDIPCTVKRTQWMFGTAWQVDGRYGLDLIVGSKGKGGTLGWLEAPAEPRDLASWRFHEISPAGWIMSIEVADVNRDGYSDVLISDRKEGNRGVHWFQHPGEQWSALSQPWSDHRIGSANEPMFMAVVAEEGALRIIVPDLDSQLLVFSQVSEEWRIEQVPYPSHAGTRGKSVAVGDLDGDGWSDLITTYEGAEERSGVWLSTYRPSGWQHFPISDTLGRKFDFASLVDMDQDGDLDVLTSEENNNSAVLGGLGVVWYENPLK